MQVCTSPEKPFEEADGDTKKLCNEEEEASEGKKPEGDCHTVVKHLAPGILRVGRSDE